MFVVLFIALVNFLLHLYFNNRYGYFRDEFNYMACGDHLAWGFVDHPPLVPFLLKICRLIFGDSLRSIRLFPALASSGTIILTAMIARELGGRRFALVLSALTIAVVPVYLVNTSILTTNYPEPLLWMGCIYFAILAIKRNAGRYWLWFGLVAGIGMEEKYSIAVFGFALVVGLLLTEQRRIFGDKWIYLGGAIAFLVFLPNFLWNIHNHWPFGAHAQYQGRRPRRGAFPLRVLRATDLDRATSCRPAMDRRSVRFPFLCAFQTLPGVRVVLPGRVRHICCAERKELLPCAYLPGVFGRGRDRD